jgi:XTP/dITP diphosphohydrolase
MTLVFASNNKNKVNEIRSLLPEYIELKSLSEIGIYDEIPETSETLEGNAQLKASFVYSRCGLNCFADDTGLEVNALNGAPGVYSARYAGLEKNPQANMDLLLQNLKSVTDRRARFRTSIALYLNGQCYFFDGIVNGTIALAKSGLEGFGYDPVFIPENETRTFAEMTLQEKNTMSHRAIAFENMIAFFENNHNEISNFKRG